MRKKNAQTKYFVGAKPTAEGGTVTYLPLAKFISAVTDGSADKTEESAFYDGDGNEQTDVIGRTEAYEFSGLYDAENAAQKLIDSLKRNIQNRGIMFKIENHNGDTIEGPATVSDIVSGSEGGGDAAAYAEFKCKITFDKTPEVTPTKAQ